MMETVDKLGTAISRHDFSTPEEHIRFRAETIHPLMDKVRYHADALEGEIADEPRPYPTYQEMLFIK